ncbi:hypothetical protein PR003_g13094 [Phytophthora rubi]|uniref:PiggyBac transposable element-derived protein domain-containing protein n=1 Tax=Phytophthora rubi TaxID=129364 RepID=A0A6A4EYA5_9STRA|nr:hypothetical protein PR003_g13094 [Phytophthora rubi]
MGYGCQSGPDRSFKNLRTGEHPVQSPRETRRPRWAPHDIDFGHLWRQLRAAGWTSKRPTGIQTQWAYKSPEGENVLLGERAVVEYAFKSGLLVEDEEHVGEEDGGGGHVGDEGGSGEHVEEEGGGGEHGEEHVREEDGGGEHAGVEGGGGDDAAIRPSQIDTSVLLSQNTIEQMFGSSDETQQPACAFCRTRRDWRVRGRTNVLLLLLLLTPRRTRIPLKLDADVNVLQDGESSSEYEDFSSDDSDSAGICDDDDDSGSDEFDEEGGDGISDSDATEMDDTFLASLHIGGNGELSKAALKQRAAALRAMQWTPPMTEFETDTPAYPGLGADEARPVGELLDVWRSPLLTLFFFVPKTVWVSIAKETNRYFLQQVGKRAEMMAARQTGRQHETAAQIARRLKASEKRGALLRIGTWSPPASRQKRRRTPVRLAHALEQSEDWVTVTGVRKRCQRSCKVCALLRTEKKKSFATTFFCERCSIVNAKCWLCNKIRRDYKGVAKTCFEIWHDDFGAGQDIPVSLGSASCCAGPTRAHESARRRAGNYSSPARKEATAATVTLKAMMSERAGCVSVGEW